MNQNNIIRYCYKRTRNNPKYYKYNVNSVPNTYIDNTNEEKQSHIIKNDSIAKYNDIILINKNIVNIDNIDNIDNANRKENNNSNIDINTNSNINADTNENIKLTKINRINLLNKLKILRYDINKLSEDGVKNDILDVIIELQNYDEVYGTNLFGGITLDNLSKFILKSSF